MGNEENHATVLLVCAGDGSKLRVMVIFKRKTVPKVENKHRVISDAQEKGGLKSLACSMWWTGETKKPACLCFRSLCDRSPRKKSSLCGSLLHCNIIS